MANNFQNYPYKRLKSMTAFQDICDALRDLVSFVQFKKHEKRRWRSVTFSKK